MTIHFLENKLVLASHNPGKLRELYDLLMPHKIKLYSAASFELEDPVEDGDSFEENALIKAKYVCEQTGLTALADDSGLCVKALDGRPGIYSARWAGESKDFGPAMSQINRLLEDKEDRSAYFKTVLAVVTPAGKEYLFEGACHGEITWPPRGRGGFGYDPIFVPDKHELTFAEMTSEEKQQLSHRAKAMQKFLQSAFTK